MSRRNVIRIPIFAAVNPDTEQTSSTISVSELDKAFIHLYLTGTPSSNINIFIDVKTHKSDEWTTLDFGQHPPKILTTETESQIFITELSANELRIRAVAVSPLSPARTLTAYATFQSEGA